MISRRLARIKTMQHLYMFNQIEGATDTEIKHSLFKSFEQSYQIYLSLLRFPVVINDQLLIAKEQEEGKYNPDSKKIEQYNLLQNNYVLTELVENSHAYITKSPIDWYADEVRLDSIVKLVLEQEFITDALVFSEPTRIQQIELLEDIFQFLLHESEEFHDWMEDMYGQWVDDEPTLTREVEKVLLALKKNENKVSKPIIKSNDEVMFSIQLFEQCVVNEKELENHIASVSSNWDLTRISIVDLLIMKMALSEFLYFELVPIKVSMNEYIELGKSHSSIQSTRFINGILDTLKNKFEKENLIIKKGRGLQ